jgi:two-component system response regulator PilR (NtrC family)
MSSPTSTYLVHPLRERKGDISLLSNYFLDLLSNEQSQGKIYLSEDAICKLQAYYFSGNVRELENILQKTLALAEGNPTHAEDLSSLNPQIENKVPVATLEARQKGTQEKLEQGEDFSLEKHLEGIEKALEEIRWNKTASAKKTGNEF